MKFRSKMVLAYTTVALLVSMILGIVVARISLQYEINSRKNSLRVSANSYVTQMDERLGRMDAIMHYILSDAVMLESIGWLAESGETLNRYVLEAKSNISAGLTTEYIMKNSYRTIFFNQNSFLASSAIYATGSGELPKQRLISDFRVEDIPYLESVTVSEGKSVIVTAHLDYWSADHHTTVYSMMKALRGKNMGFLEVENRVESLHSLEISDPNVDFLILVNGDELLYASDETYGTVLSERDRERMDSLQEDRIRMEKDVMYTKASSREFDLTILAYNKNYLLKKERMQLFSVSFLATMVTLAISLTMIVFWAGVLTKPIKSLQETVENTNIENLLDNQHLGKEAVFDEFQELICAYQAMMARLDEALKNEKQAAMLQLQAQFDMLQAQVNPHFIYNVLNVISSRAVLDNDEAICEMCGSLGNMLRYSTNNQERYATVEKELEYLNSYFYLLKARRGDWLEVSIELDQELKKQMIPKLTLQQFVENCVKHGFQNMTSGRQIVIQGSIQADSWKITVRDNGQGISDQTLEQLRNRLSEVRQDILERGKPAEMGIGGMGIINTYARCLLLYSQDLIFEIENVPDGSGCSVTIGRIIQKDHSTNKTERGYNKDTKRKI